MTSWPDTDTLEISVEAVAALRAAGEEFSLIDCREEDEWKVCRIDGAMLMPLSGFGGTVMERFRHAGERVVIHCHHGMRSARAAQFLRDRGMQHAWSMAGGIDAWSRDIDSSVPRY